MQENEELQKEDNVDNVETTENTTNTPGDNNQSNSQKEEKLDSQAIVSLSRKLRDEKNRAKKLEEELAKFKSSQNETPKETKPQEFKIPEEFKELYKELKENKVKKSIDNLLNKNFDQNLITEYLEKHPKYLDNPKDLEKDFIYDHLDIYTKLLSQKQNKVPQINLKTKSGIKMDSSKKEMFKAFAEGIEQSLGKEAAQIVRDTYKSYK